MGNSQWEREWNGLHNWESRAHRLHEVIGTQHKSLHFDIFTLYPYSLDRASRLKKKRIPHTYIPRRI